MGTPKRHQPQPSTPDPIASLERAITDASEQNWECHGVSLEERERLRPGVAALASAVTDRLRAEHLARSGARQ